MRSKAISWYTRKIERRAEEIVSATLERRWQRLLECRTVPEFQDRIPFVGGPWHGRFVSMPELPTRYLAPAARSGDLAATHIDYPTGVMDEDDLHEYRRFRVGAADTRLWRWSYASTELDEFAVMDLLSSVIAEMWIAAAPLGHGNAVPE